jgi:hypothetical protein
MGVPLRYSDIVRLTEDPLVCPPLSGPDPFRTPGWSYAQEWAAHIESCLTLLEGAHEDPSQLIIY